MNPVEQHIFRQKEPHQSIMLYVRSVILKTLPDIEERYSYKIPFYYFHKKPMVYINILKGTSYVDIAFMDGNYIQEKFPQLKDFNNRKRVRSIQVKSLEEFDEKGFVDILMEATILISKKRK
jgi:hypothetical protein